jgi:hypothetical protein
MRTKALIVLLSLTLIAAACGGDDSSDAAPPEGDAPSVDGDPDASDSEDGDAGGSVSGIDGGVGDFTPGDRGFRVVNLSDQAVDVYGFTDGLVEEYEVLLGVEPGVITDRLFAPKDGRLVLTEAGATDVTEFGAPNLGEFSDDNFPEHGNVHTLLLSTSPETGEFGVNELWEDHDGSNPSGNALAAAATDGTGTVIMMTASFDGDSFKPSEPGGTTCLSPRDPGKEATFIGGTQIIEYDVAPPTFEFDLHSFGANDLRCEDAAALAGGSIDVAAGERVLGVIVEKDGDLEIITLPLG